MRLKHMDLTFFFKVMLSRSVGKIEDRAVACLPINHVISPKLISVFILFMEPKDYSDPIKMAALPARQSSS